MTSLRTMRTLNPANSCNPCLHLTLFALEFSEPDGCCCCARSSHGTVVSSGSTRWGQYLRNHSASLLKLLFSVFISVFCSPPQNNFIRRISRSSSCWRKRPRSSGTWQTPLLKRTCQAPDCSSEPTLKRHQKARPL